MNSHRITVIDAGRPEGMEPVVCCLSWQQIPIAGLPLEQLLIKRLSTLSELGTVKIHPGLWPSDALLTFLESSNSIVITDNDGSELLKFVRDGDTATPESSNDLHGSLLVRHPWDLVELNSIVVGGLTENKIAGTVRERVSIDGYIQLGENSIILPGVYIEGNVVIGNDCKIGPNCYIRGNTSIGNNCHIGQAVEVKNSLFMDDVSAGHLSYIGDSIIAHRSNLGAGTITANLRHDGKPHASMVGESLIDTGRRKLGVIMGEDVHTGINTSIYPGRKIWPHGITCPGEIVKKDIKPQ